MSRSVAEYFRDQGQQVLCLIDLCNTLCDGTAGNRPLSAGEPPTPRLSAHHLGELARLLERAGPGGPGQGSITGLFSVLVEGDDHNEPVSDAVRGIVDGHIVMSRDIADRGRYPAIDVLKSISRSMPKALNDSQNAVIRRAKQVISTYEDMAELIRLGAYRKGSDPAVDEALILYPQIEEFLTQHKDESTTIEDSFARLATIVGMG
ncbi:MAG: FliI/YscN family ATPase [Alphaproteobacteria bacterium]